MATVHEVAPKRVTHSLVHPDRVGGYDFTPCADSVEVEHTTKRTHNTYTLTIEEARHLWQRLRNQGYERF